MRWKDFTSATSRRKARLSKREVYKNVFIELEYIENIEPRPARLALLADHVARGVALLLHVTNQPWISSVDLDFSNTHHLISELLY